ncbi:unnamed protein product [Phytophthora fragariaefolia]|uniref:Unnamed protein product n=1 Tax=Phytophthora fragariaefolia TaxID=1490495 RepID=A0A9W6XUI4_9STRA|nr:unnamed protein product [Phytophthora fragariaefolia]
MGTRKKVHECEKVEGSEIKQLNELGLLILILDRDTDLAYDRAMFGAVWRVLRGRGWTSKRPNGRSLNDMHLYIPPDGTPNGTIGVDYFLGERALLEYYRQTFGLSNSGGDITTRLTETNDNSGVTSHEITGRSTLEASGEGTASRYGLWCDQRVESAENHDEVEGTRAAFCSENAQEQIIDISAGPVCAVCNAACSTERSSAIRVDSESVRTGGDERITSDRSNSNSLAHHHTNTSGSTKSSQKKSRSQYKATGLGARVVPKGKAPLQKNRPAKTIVTAMKDELTRRVRTSAEKFVGASVAFTPSEVSWMPLSLYRDVGAAYLLGVVTRYAIRPSANSENISVPTAQFQIDWTCTSFQSKVHVHHASEDTITRGISQFAKIYVGFFAFIPLSFWNQVVVSSNNYADSSGNPSARAINLDELMKFLGIMWYMTLIDKGEMRNYWVDDEEASIFPGSRSRSLGSIMTWRRFIYIRKYLSFRSNVTRSDVQRDPAARIRPLINILKSRCLQHVDVGRNVAVDEASIACRSRYARHIIVFNPQKPTGKYHFKLYVCCCSTSWYAVIFKLHCSSLLDDRMDGVVPQYEVLQLAKLTEKSSDVRSHVMEVTSSLNESSRIINTDNFYTSCLLLESLRSVGLYGRGTVRKSSKHFPHFTMIRKSDAKPRGFIKQGVCLEKHIVAASWVDGSIVNVVSNADASSSSTVSRRLKEAHVTFTAPTCISEYNSAMQGVDRHDQLRGRFSLADGHSFQKWHKKLAMAIIDIARCNAYICDSIARDSYQGRSSNQSESKARDRHRSFVISLVRELFNGDWKACIDRDCGMVYAATTASTTTSAPPRNVRSEVSAEIIPTQGQVCVAKESWWILQGRSRSMRKCTVCKFECRDATQKTDYCETHRVALCKRTYPVDTTKEHLCQQPMWTCWQKYHSFYLPKQIYTMDGNLSRASSIYKIQQPFLKEQRRKRHITSDQSKNLA